MRVVLQSFGNGNTVYSTRGKEGIGLGMEFRKENLPRNRIGTVSVIPWKKVLILRHSEFRRRTECNGILRKKLGLQNSQNIFKV